MGMYSICCYEKFSTTDVAKFERRLMKWCREECMHGKSMLIFDKSSLSIERKTEIEVMGATTFYKLALPNITLVYTCIANTSMCTIHKIWENTTQSVMYNMPQKWEGTELWLCK